MRMMLNLLREIIDPIKKIKATFVAGLTPSGIAHPLHSNGNTMKQNSIH